MDFGEYHLFPFDDSVSYQNILILGCISLIFHTSGCVNSICLSKIRKMAHSWVILFFCCFVISEEKLTPYDRHYQPIEEISGSGQGIHINKV